MSTELVDDLPLANTGELLVEVGEYSVRQNEKYRWLQDGNAIQSVMDRQNPAKLLLPTHHAMFCAVACLPQATRVLNLGCGPGAVERKLNRDFQHLSCTSVDVSEQVIDLAKDYFQLPEDHAFIIMRAEEFLASNTDRFDIVMVDLFEHTTMAECFYDWVFYRDINSCIDPAGIVAFNLIPQDQNDLLQILLPLRQYFPNVWFSEIAGRSNIVLLATMDTEFNPGTRAREGLSDRRLFDFDPILDAEKFSCLPMPVLL